MSSPKVKITTERHELRKLTRKAQLVAEAMTLYLRHLLADDCADLIFMPTIRSKTVTFAHGKSFVIRRSAGPIDNDWIWRANLQAKLNGQTLNKERKETGLRRSDLKSACRIEKQEAELGV